MRIRKLRLLLEQYGDTTLRDIIVEIYRQLPKQTIEDKELDLMLSQFAKYKGLKKEQEQPTIEQTIEQTEQFIQLAYDGEYLEPSTIVSVREQKNWYVTAKRLLKHLRHYVGRKNGTRVAFEEFFFLLSSAAGEEPLFLSNDPFRLIKVSQVELFQELVGYYKLDTSDNAWMKRAIYTALKVPIDVDTERSDLFLAVLEHCETRQERESYLSLLNMHAKKLQMNVRIDADKLILYQEIRFAELHALIALRELERAETMLFTEYIPYFSHRSTPFRYYLDLLEQAGLDEEHDRIERVGRTKHIHF
ncbi:MULTISPECIES: hypothetical protein [unclassified Exiguobacterium]|uniref:hypothetical protein n=1 Tax=unclassified Exiguobacterium TaxID=2644629 RepID=UPI000B58F15A|nr:MULTISPECIES: hypothetical protein [unclassified Exiguobacterium]ASI34539.1 hypothetical protein A0126_02775 [Exiguobacterium sp. N4-1P]